jgi:hypothetical protein
MLSEKPKETTRFVPKLRTEYECGGVVESVGKLKSREIAAARLNPRE